MIENSTDTKVYPLDKVYDKDVTMIEKDLGSTEPIWIDWEEGDVENPINFSIRRKWSITIICCLFTVLVAISGTSFPSGITEMVEELHCSQQLGILAYSAAPLGFGLAPLVTSPFSEAYGRYRIYVISCAIWTLTLLPLALGNSISLIIVFRFISGSFASTGGTLVAGSIADLWVTKDRGSKMALLTVSAFVGSGIGPASMGWVNQFLGWRYIQWIQIALAVGMTVLLVFSGETRGSKLLSDRAARMRKETGDERYQCQSDSERATLLILIKVSMTRPIYLLMTEPVLAFVSLWVGFSWASVFLSIVGVNFVFKEVYGFSDGQAGMVLLTVAVGSLIGASVNLYQEKIYARNVATRGVEARLYTSMFGSFLFPCGQAVFAFTQGRTHWIIPILALIVSYTGVFFIYLASFNYLADCYTIYAASALSGQSLCRNILGAILPLFATKMYSNLGYQWASFVSAGVGFLLSGTPFVLFFYGPELRSRSKFFLRLLAQEKKALRLASGKDNEEENGEELISGYSETEK